MNRFSHIFLSLTAVVSLSLLLPKPVVAVGGGVPDYVYQVCVTSITINKVLVSTTNTPSNVLPSSITWTNQMDSPSLANRAWMQIENNDPFQSLWCQTSTGALTTGGGIGTGYRVAPSTQTFTSTPSVWNVPVAASAYTGPNFNATVGALHIYCVTDAATASTATVVQCY